MKVAVTPLTRKYVEGKFRFFTLINVILDVALPGTLIGHSRAPPPALRASLPLSHFPCREVLSVSVTRGEANAALILPRARARVTLLLCVSCTRTADEQNRIISEAEERE